MITTLSLIKNKNNIITVQKMSGNKDRSRSFDVESAVM